MTPINTRRGARALTHPNEVGQRLIELNVPIDRGRVITVLTIQFRCFLRLVLVIILVQFVFRKFMYKVLNIRLLIQ